MADGYDFTERDTEDASKIPLYKIVLVGEMEVGKTSLFKRYEKNIFSDLRTSTKGVDNCSKVEKVDGKACKINLWDTAGMERLGSITSHYYHQSAAVALVYSIDEHNSLNNLSSWIEDVDRYAKGARKFLVGNKIDLDRERLQVEERTAVSFGDNNNISEACLYRVSAKTGVGVQAMFQSMAKQLMKHAQPTVPRDDAFHIHTTTEEKKQSRCC